MTKQENATTTMKEQLPPEAQLMQTLGACFISQAAYVAAKLGIADLVAEGPKHIAELAAASETDERSLYRVLRTLAIDRFDCRSRQSRLALSAERRANSSPK